MTDEFLRERSRRLIKLYARFRDELDVSPLAGRYLPYDWWNLPDPLGGQWMFYRLRLSEYARELANAINGLTNRTHHLRAWAGVIASLTDDEKFEATHEIIDDLATVALGLPYAIKSRFAFAAAQLCHEANIVLIGPTPGYEMPSDKIIGWHNIDAVCRSWDSFRPLIQRAKELNGASLATATTNFRNAYNHQFPRRLVFGRTSRFTREKAENGGRVCGFGEEKPLQLDGIWRLLEQECGACYRTFEAFQALVTEQTKAIAIREAMRG